MLKRFILGTRRFAQSAVQHAYQQQTSTLNFDIKEQIKKHDHDSQNDTKREATRLTEEVEDRLDKKDLEIRHLEKTLNEKKNLFDQRQSQMAILGDQSFELQIKQNIMLLRENWNGVTEDWYDSYEDSELFSDYDLSKTEVEMGLENIGQRLWDDDIYSIVKVEGKHHIIFRKSAFTREGEEVLTAMSCYGLDNYVCDYSIE